MQQKDQNYLLVQRWKVLESEEIFEFVLDRVQENSQELVVEASVVVDVLVALNSLSSELLQYLKNSLKEVATIYNSYMFLTDIYTSVRNKLNVKAHRIRIEVINIYTQWQCPQTCSFCRTRTKQQRLESKERN